MLTTPSFVRYLYIFSVDCLMVSEVKVYKYSKHGTCRLTFANIPLLYLQVDWSLPRSSSIIPSDFMHSSFIELFGSLGEPKELCDSSVSDECDEEASELELSQCSQLHDDDRSLSTLYSKCCKVSIPRRSISKFDSGILFLKWFNFV